MKLSKKLKNSNKINTSLSKNNNINSEKNKIFESEINEEILNILDKEDKKNRNLKK